MTSRKPSRHLPSIGLWLGAFALAALGIADPATATSTVHHLTLVMREFGVQPVTLQFRVPASARGKWEMGSFVPRDYESGMNGTIVIE